MKPVRIFIPQDSVAVALGADALVQAFTQACTARNLAIEVVRNSSWGLFWLEPMLEVETAEGRIAYGPVIANDAPSIVASLLDAGFLEGKPHQLRQGLTQTIPFLAQQERLIFVRAGITQPLSLTDYVAHGGWQGLKFALEHSPEALVAAVSESGLRGRGGAAFPTGIKWKTVLQAQSAQKYVVCNADEGDSGTFADRMLMEGDPFLLIEGMLIAGLATGAEQGYIYIRSEYPKAIAQMRQAIDLARAAHYLGPDILGSGKAFELSVCAGAGSYVCGEETALLESLEGKRGIVRAKPPLPALEGLLGRPTAVNNAITLASVPWIIANGAAAYQNFGQGRSRGTLTLQLAGNVQRGGLVEKAFGLSLRELLYDFGGGSRSGLPMKAVQVGGPLGAYVPESAWDTPLDYEAFAGVGAAIGHGGVVVHDSSADMSKLARHAMHFCAVESCGKCTPCRIGAVRGVEVIDRIRAGVKREQQVVLLRDLCNTMVDGSLCAMGGMTPFPVLSALEHYPADFGLSPNAE